MDELQPSTNSNPVIDKKDRTIIIFGIIGLSILILLSPLDGWSGISLVFVLIGIIVFRKNRLLGKTLILVGAFLLTYFFLTAFAISLILPERYIWDAVSFLKFLFVAVLFIIGLSFILISAARIRKTEVSIAPSEQQGVPAAEEISVSKNKRPLGFYLAILMIIICTITLKTVMIVKAPPLDQTSGSTLSDCDAKKEWSEKNYCYNDVARHNEDESVCDKMVVDTTNSPIKVTSRDSCYAQIAELKKDSTICEKIGNDIGENYCFRLVASELKDLSICDKIKTNTYIAVDNYDYVYKELTSKDQCYGDIAADKEDTSICEKVNDIIGIDYCYQRVAVTKRDLSICSKIKNYQRNSQCNDQTKLMRHE